MSNLNRSVARPIPSLVRMALVAMAGLVPLTVQASAATTDATVIFKGVFRDFRSANASNGHPDFETDLPNGAGVYTGIAADQLNEVGKPVFASTGHKCTLMPRNALGQNIIGPKPYLDSKLGDLPGVASTTEDRAVVSLGSFGKWFDATIGATNSQITSIPMTQSGTRFVYDGELRKDFDRISGTGSNKNWAFTFELGSEFVFRPGNNETLTCGADDCLWVYIDGRLVIDLGGQHGYMEQTFSVNRLQGLVNGKKYSIKFFYAERKKTASRLKIDTTLGLNGLAAPAVSGTND